MSFGWYEVAYGPGGYSGPGGQVPPCERNLGYRITGWSFPFGPALTFQHNGDLVTRVTNTVGRYVQLASDSVADSQSRTMSFNSSGVWTDLTGGQWKYQQANPVPVSDTVRPTPYGRLTKVFEPVNTSQAALEYIYDATGRVKEAKDAVAIQTPA